MSRFKKALYFLLFFLFLIFSPPFAKAQQFKSDYKVEYFLHESQKSIDTDTKFSIKITNLENDVYVSKFTLAFPKSFEISGLQATDDKGKIEPNVVSEPDKTKIELEFTDPATGPGSQNNFYVNFKQKNLFQINGNVWEVILPTISTNENEKYQVVVHLPENTTKKISIAKPRPDLIQGNTIYWNDPKIKTIYAIFGDKQVYQMRLVYNLSNPRLTAGYTDIALPPDSLYQKVFINSINQVPERTYLDEDGNLLARYTLRPRENKKIVLEGYTEVYSQYRPELKKAENNRLATQKRYLLSESKYWKLSSAESFKNLRSVKDIYNFAVTNFSYDYSRLNKQIQRLGADKALRNPKTAVCTEFSDSFVALSRDKGIMSREIQGYGFSQDENLRPLSLVTDVLHSWPEYYDDEKDLWTPIDPTWENTSGIDYFNSFDLNHIVFAIHGKKPDEPLPAGSYKFENTKDVEVKPSLDVPEEIMAVELSNLEVGNSLNKNKTYSGTFEIKNNGNTFLYDLPINIESVGLALDKKVIILGSLAPLESRKVEFVYQTLGGSNLDSQIKISTPYGDPLVKSVKVFSPLILIIALSIAAAIGGGGFLYWKYFLRRA